MNVLDTLGVQSYCFRNFKDNREVASKVYELGLSRIEICAAHADFNDPKSWKGQVAIYDDCGISIPSIGVQTFEANDSEEAFFECAAIAGAKHISAHFKAGTFPSAVAKVKNWSDKYDIKVGLHNHGGYMFGGQPDVVDLLINLGTPQIGLCLDTAWALQIGPGKGNPVDWVKKYGRSLYAIHFKDFAFAKNGAWNDTVVGEGNLDLKAILAELERVDYDGVSILEYEANPDNPVPALKECLERMRAVFA